MFSTKANSCRVNLFIHDILLTVSMPMLQKWNRKFDFNMEIKKCILQVNFSSEFDSAFMIIYFFKTKNSKNYYI